MDLVKWNSMRDVFDFGRHFDRMFSDFLAPSQREQGTDTFWNWQPAVDIYDKDDTIVIKAELPGVDKKDIHVDLKGRVLTLTGERSMDREEKEDACYCRERSYGRFVRSFNLAADVKPDQIEAAYKDGVLHITIPKAESVKPKQITVH